MPPEELPTSTHALRDLSAARGALDRLAEAPRELGMFVVLKSENMPLFVQFCTLRKRTDHHLVVDIPAWQIKTDAREPVMSLLAYRSDPYPVFQAVVDTADAALAIAEQVLGAVMGLGPDEPIQVFEESSPAPSVGEC